MDTMEQLANLNRVPVDMTLAGLRSVQQGQQRDNIGLADLAAKSQFTQQMNPLKLAEQELQNKGLGITNDQGLATLHKQRRENVENDFTTDVRKQAEYKKLLAQADEQDIKTALYQAQKMMFSNDPKLKKQGEAIFAMTKEHWDAKQKQGFDMAQIGARQAGAEKLMGMQIAAGRFDKKGGGGGAKSIEDQVKAGKLNFERAAVMYAVLAEEMDDDDPRKEAYLAKAKQMETAHYQSRQAAGQATPKIDAGQVANMPTTGGTTPPSALGGAPAAGDKVRVVHPDGRVGTIPRANLEAAKARGFKESK